MPIVDVRCLKNYRSRDVVYEAGKVYLIEQAEFGYLDADAPGCFEIAPEMIPEPKALDEPPIDKMVRKPKAKK